MNSDDVQTLLNFCKALILDIKASRTPGAAGSNCRVQNFLSSTTAVVTGFNDLVNRCDTHHQASHGTGTVGMGTAGHVDV